MRGARYRVSAGAILLGVTIATAARGELIDLGTLGGDDSEGLDVNASGQVVGYSTLPDDFYYHAFLYSGGVMTDLGTLGGSFSSALRINDSGVVAGQAHTASGDSHAFRYSSGVMTDLGTLGGDWSGSEDMNASGDIVGAAETAAGTGHAFLHSGGVMTDLGTLGGMHSRALAINDSGRITGWSQTAGGEEHAFLYSGGVMTDLGTLGGTMSQGVAINDAGQLVGFAADAGDKLHAFLYSGGVMTDLGPTGSDSWSTGLALNGSAEVAGRLNGDAFPFFYSAGSITRMADMVGNANDMNDSGQVVGWAEPTGESSDRPFIYSFGVLSALGTTGGRALAINESGQVTGHFTVSVGETRAFLRNPACGDGIVDAAEECDDANTVGGDCCAADCTYPGPATTCVDAGRSSLDIKSRGHGSNDRLKWKWLGSDHVSYYDIGHPSDDTTYTLCISDSTGGTDRLVSIIRIDPGSAWTTAFPKAWRYKGSSPFDHGVRQVRLQTGDKPRAVLAAQRSAIPLPAPVSGTQFFDMDGRITVQLFQDASPTCWSAEFTSAELNTPERFTAELP